MSCPISVNLKWQDPGECLVRPVSLADVENPVGPGVPESVARPGVPGNVAQWARPGVPGNAVQWARPDVPESAVR